jgi:hypothetical protein
MAVVAMVTMIPSLPEFAIVNRGSDQLVLYLDFLFCQPVAIRDISHGSIFFLKQRQKFCLIPLIKKKVFNF